MTESEIMTLCGEAGIRRMVAAFYQRIRHDDLIGPMYPDDDWEGSELRLAEFILFRLGHSKTYLDLRGHPRLRARHMPFRIGIRERDRWLELMHAAILEADLPQPAATKLMDIFSQIADFMRNQTTTPTPPSFSLSKPTAFSLTPPPRA